MLNTTSHTPDNDILKVPWWCRFFLIGIIAPVFSFYQPYPEYMDNWYFITAMFTLGTFAIITNFPSALIMMHTKPMFWSDLIDNANYDHLANTDRYKFQKRFLLLNGCVVFFTVPAILDYYFNQREHETWWDAILLLYVSFCFLQTVMSYCGAFMLWLMDVCKRRQQSRFNSPVVNPLNHLSSTTDRPPILQLDP